MADCSKVGRENVVLQHEVEKAEFFKEQTRAKLAREEEEAKKERKCVHSIMHCYGVCLVVDWLWYCARACHSFDAGSA